MVTSEILKASAGSGKTYTLTERILSLIQTRNPFIVALTFTKAATAEMRKRILDRIDDSKLDYAEKLRLIMKAGRVHFATFDSLFYQVLAAQGDFFQLADDKESELIREKIRKGFFEEVHRIDKIESVIIASRMLRISLENLTEKLDKNGASRFIKNDPVGRELGELIADTARLKKEIQELLQRLQPFENEDLPASVKRSVISLCRLDTEELAGRTALCYEDLSEWVGLGKKINWNTEPFVSLRVLVRNVRERLVVYLLNRALLKESTLTELHHVYDSVARRLKAGEHKLFFEDVLDRLICLDGRDCPVRSELMGLYFEMGLDRVQHLMIDEFQDTSRDNMALLMPLIEEVLSEVGEQGTGERSLFAVGDWKQMIYGWRGADRQAVEKELSRYHKRQLKENVLPHNWRSTPLLIDFFNRAVQEIFSGDERLECQEPAEKRHAGISEISLVRVKLERNQKDPLYQEMVDTLVRKREDWGCDYSEITLLFRTNSEKEAVAQKLADAGIGSAEVKGRQLLACEEGVLVFALLLHLFAGRESRLTGLVLERSPLPEKLMERVRDKARILAAYVGPYGLKAVSDVLELCRGSIPDGMIETWQEEAEAFFRTGGRDAEAFLTYLFKIRNRISVPEPAHSNRVKLATIHGTKGLEFRHVLLLWTEESRPFSFYVPEYGCHVSCNAQELKFWESCRTEDARCILCAHGLERQKLDSERANVLYVALTRATHSITVFVKEPGGNEENGKQGLTRKLISIIENGPFEAECIRAGNRVTWRKDYGEAETRASSDVHEIDHAPLPALEARPVRLPEMDPLDLSRAVREGIEKGRRVHDFLARLTNRSLLPQVHDLSPDEFASVQAFLDDPNVAELLFRPGKIYIEQPISNCNLYGVPDRMIVERHRITLIDYKTGSVGELMPVYQEQLNRYGAIMKSLYPDRAVELYLLLIEEQNKIVRVI